MIKEELNKIMKIMNSIEYGFIDAEGNNIALTNPKKWDEEFDDFYYLQTPEELLKTKCGVCWEQVELERSLFTKANIDFKTYFIFISDQDMLPSHTFLTFKDNDKYYWFEHSWAKYRGIHEYNSESNLLHDVINKFKEDHQEVNKNANSYLYEYEKPQNHIKCNEFYKYIETQKKIDLKTE